MKMLPAKDVVAIGIGIILVYLSVVNTVYPFYSTIYGVIGGLLISYGVRRFF